MCNVIILLNKPLEEDIPFTTSSEAGTFKHFFCLFVFSRDVKMSMLLNLEWMIFYLSVLDLFYFVFVAIWAWTVSFQNSTNRVTGSKNRKKDISRKRRTYKISIHVNMIKLDGGGGGKHEGDNTLKWARVVDPSEARPQPNVRRTGRRKRRNRRRRRWSKRSRRRRMKTSRAATSCFSRRPTCLKWFPQ